jgi:hypothetical protein
MKRTITLLLTGTTSLFVGNSNAKPFESYYEHPEDVVAKAMYSCERCNESFPEMKASMDRSFEKFQTLNKTYFDSVRSAPDFEEGYRAIKKYFAELEITASGCREVIEILSSPESKIVVPSRR